MPRQAVVTPTQGLVTVTPSAPQAEVYVNNQRVHDVTVLQPSMTVRFGKMYLFQFFEPMDEVGGPRQKAVSVYSVGGGQGRRYHWQ